MRRKAASTVRATASGSVFSARDVNPTTSAKSTVASLRSPAEGAASPGAAAASPLKREPQLPQKRWPVGLAKPQDGQAAPPSAVPHEPQKRNSAGFSAPQDRQGGTASDALGREPGSASGGRGRAGTGGGS